MQGWDSVSGFDLGRGRGREDSENLFPSTKGPWGRSGSRQGLLPPISCHPSPHAQPCPPGGPEFEISMEKFLGEGEGEMGLACGQQEREGSPGPGHCPAFPIVSPNLWPSFPCVTVVQRVCYLLYLFFSLAPNCVPEFTNLPFVLWGGVWVGPPLRCCKAQTPNISKQHVECCYHPAKRVPIYLVALGF